VISDIRSLGLTGAAPFEFYVPVERAQTNTQTIVIRTKDDDPTKIIPVARQIMASIDPSLPVSTIQTMNQVVSGSIAQPRLMSSLTGLFGGLAGLLAMVGIYGVMAYNVRRQRRDFGIRIALGADHLRVQRVVVMKGLLLAGIGVAVGVLGSLMLTGFLRTMLNDVKPTDISVFVLIGVLVQVVAFLASYFPARSASRVDPMVVLRDS
jgi:putative ABC transport system permease protein